MQQGEYQNDCTAIQYISIQSKKAKYNRYDYNKGDDEKYIGMFFCKLMPFINQFTIYTIIDAPCIEQMIGSVD